MPSNGIVWTSDTLTPGMAGFAVAMHEGLEEIMEQMAEEVQGYAQQNAPWEDDTGDAREGLTAEAESSIGEAVIILYHTVDYGIWLEVRNSGEYAIIIPTIEQMGPAVMAQVETLFAVA